MSGTLRRLVGFLFVVIATSPLALYSRTPDGPPHEISIFDDITYGHGGDVALKLDLAKPVGNGPFPAIVFIHGGGWCQGSRKSFREWMLEGARRGYVSVSINYRLMKYDEETKETTTAEPHFPAQIHDCKAAVRWLRANAAEYGVDSNRIGVIGGSAGGHLSLLIGLSDARDDLEGTGGHPNQSSRVHAVVNVFGVTDMVTCYEHKDVGWLLRLFLGGTPKEAASNYKSASPITYLSADDPPILTLHGDQDSIVPVSQAIRLDEASRIAGVRHTLRILKGHDHGPATMGLEESREAIWSFFQQELQTR